MNDIKLSILDQSPVISGHTPARAVQETIRLVKAAEALGFHRYWLAEHHALAALADPCPEILLTRIAAETTRIRVGTGGILLPYYSPFKVAEQFRMLEALYPGRIEHAELLNMRACLDCLFIDSEIEFFCQGCGSKPEFLSGFEFQRVISNHFCEFLNTGVSH